MKKVKSHAIKKGGFIMKKLTQTGRFLRQNGCNYMLLKKKTQIVIPAKAGIQRFNFTLDTRLRGYDRVVSVRLNKLVFIVIVMFTLLESPLSAESMLDLRNQGYLIVTPGGPDDGGDYGPNTPGTTTAGIQEAIDYAKSLQSVPHAQTDLYIAKGDYLTYDTIRIPWLGEKLQFNAQHANIAYQQTTGDAIVIDSQMNGRFNFGAVSALNLGAGNAVIRLKPEDPASGPNGQTAVITCTRFEIDKILVREGYDPGDPTMASRANGLVLDGSLWGVIWNEIKVGQINTADKGIRLIDDVGCNWIDVRSCHGCNTAIDVGDIDGTPYDNRIDLSADSEGVPDSIGARIYGINNILTLTVYETAADKNVIFENSARNNIVYATKLPNGITNNAATPTNKIVYNQPVGYNITTPAIPASDVYQSNTEPYAVVIMILTPGAVSSWTVRDANGVSDTVASQLLTGQSIYLDPGDSIKFTYTVAPTWRWRAIR